MSSRKADQFTLVSGDAVHEYFLSVAIILCNKSTYVHTWLAFTNPVTYHSTTLSVNFSDKLYCVSLIAHFHTTT